MVVMPDLAGKSRRIAVPMLEISGLELEALTYRPDESCTDCVLDQLYLGKPIAPGRQIRKGEKVTLVLGQRSNQLTSVPRLLGISYQDAYALLNAYSLNMGEVLSCQGCETAEDTTNAFVINQIPLPHEDASLGSFVDLYLSTDSLKAAEFFSQPDTSSYEVPDFN
jgi:beta-lactam-binding protein with PASTA domain